MSLERTVPAAEVVEAPRSPWVVTGRAAALERVQGVLSRASSLDEEVGRLATQAAGNLDHPWLALLGAVLLCLAIGVALERFMLRPSGVLGGLRALGQRAGGERLSPGQVLAGAAARSGGALVFLAGAALALNLMTGLGDGLLALASGAVWVVGLSRIVITGLHALLLPAGGDSPWPLLRPVAQAIARHLSIVSAVVLLRVVSVEVLVLLGASHDLYFVSALVFGVFIVVSLLFGVFAVRRAMGPVLDRAALAAAGGGVWRLLADRWHILVTVYVLLVLVIGTYGALASGQSVLARGLASLSLLLVLPVADYALRLLAARLAPLPPEPAAAVLPPVDAFDWVEGGLDAEGGLGAMGDGAPVSAEATASSVLPPLAAVAAGVAPVSVKPAPAMEPGEHDHAPDGEVPVAGAPHDRAPPRSLVEDALVFNFRLLLGLASIAVVASLWKLRPLDLVSALLGARIAGALSEVAIASLFAFVIWQIAKAAVAAHAVPEPPAGELGGEGGGTGRTRAQTLLPLVAKTVSVVLVVMLVMITLSALGVNIGPLLASAGVIGLAVGFGTQTLVRDIVSGLFFLADDAFRMGEYLQIGNIRGTVEKISARSLRLRHHRGALHTLPYGEIKSMTNYSRDYAIMKFEVRVPFETDVEKVRKLIKHVGVELAENEEMASVMLEPLKSQGVNRMDDSAFVIRCKFTTLPGKQFGVRRVAFAMIQEAFAREGITFAPKRVVVETVAPPGSAQALAAAAAAADASATADAPATAAER
jgi:small-conductance mechanosensitive channel